MWTGLKAISLLTNQQELLVNQIKTLNEKVTSAGGDNDQVDSVNGELHGQ